MIHIRPVTDLRNHFTDISKIVHEQQGPIFLTKNGFGDMVVLSIEQYAALTEDKMVLSKLRAAAAEASTTEERYDFFETAEEMRKKLSENV